MKAKYYIKNYSCILFLSAVSINLNAQVGIGTTSPDPSSVLHIDNNSGDKGILIPQVALTASNIGSPITPTPAVDLLVYNTATAGSGNNTVSPDYHFWNGTDHQIYSNSYSTHNKGIGSGGTNYYAIWHQSSLIIYVDVIGGTTYNFNLSFDQFDTPGFINNGNSGNG